MRRSDATRRVSRVSLSRTVPIASRAPVHRRCVTPSTHARARVIHHPHPSSIPSVARRFAPWVAIRCLYAIRAPSIRARASRSIRARVACRNIFFHPSVVSSPASRRPVVPSLARHPSTSTIAVGRRPRLELSNRPDDVPHHERARRHTRAFTDERRDTHTARRTHGRWVVVEPHEDGADARATTRARRGDAMVQGGCAGRGRARGVRE